MKIFINLFSISFFIFFTGCNSNNPIVINFDYYKKYNLKLGIQIDEIKLKKEDITEYSNVKNNHENVYLVKNYYKILNDSIYVESMIITENNYIQKINSDFNSLDTNKLNLITDALIKNYIFKNELSSSNFVTEYKISSNNNFKIVIFKFNNGKKKWISINSSMLH